MDDNAELLSLLRAVVAEVAGLRADLARRVPAADHAVVLELLAAIHDAVGDRAFTSRDLLTHAEVARAWRLRTAIGNVVGVKSPARALGCALASCEGVQMGGLTIQRTGSQGNVAVWRVCGTGRVSSE